MGLIVLSETTLRAYLFKNLFTVSFRDLRYILVSLIKKSSTLENKIRDQFTVKSGNSNLLQQHAEKGETVTFFSANQIEACEMYSLSNDTRKHACEMAVKEKWENTL